MKSPEYLAVFQSLSHAGQVRNKFLFSKRPELIKTPGKIAGGCSYALVFGEEQLSAMKQLCKRHSKGCVGIYRKTGNNHYEDVGYDLS